MLPPWYSLTSKIFPPKNSLTLSKHRHQQKQKRNMEIFLLSFLVHADKEQYLSAHTRSFKLLYHPIKFVFLLPPPPAITCHKMSSVSHPLSHCLCWSDSMESLVWSCLELPATSRRCSAGPWERLPSLAGSHARL